MKVLLIGPLPDPITGNSLINSIIVNNFSFYYNNIKVDAIDFGAKKFTNKYGKFNLKKIFEYMNQYKFLYKIFFNDTIYMSVGHTFYGIVKYVPFILLSKIFGKQIVIHIHTDSLWLLYNKSSNLKKYILKKILGSADKGIVLSSILKRNLRPFLKETKIYTLANFVPDDFLEYDMEENLKRKFNGKIKILFLSNLLEDKGIIDFLKAMELLKAQNKEFEIHIAGDIPDEMQEKIQIYFEKFENILQYHGVVRDRKKLDLFLSCNVFVFPTLREAQGVVLLEAMATFNIILSTNVGGIPDIFKKNINGLSIKVNNPKDIAMKLTRIMDNPSLYLKMVRNNYLYIKSNYTEKQFFANLKKILMD
jgi:glycosyltransferase involved in cell wall biosynthesis